MKHPRYQTSLGHKLRKNSGDKGVGKGVRCGEPDPWDFLSFQPSMRLSRLCLLSLEV